MPPDSKPTSTCAQLSVGMCDGFEEPTLNSRWTSASTAGSTVTLDTSRAYRGNGSIHAHTLATTAGVTATAKLRVYEGTNGLITGVAHVRVWAYFASPYPTAYEQALIFATNSGQGIAAASVGGFVESNDFTYGQYRISTMTMWPIDRWACLELAIPSNSEGTTRFYIDDVEVTDVAITTPTGMPEPAPDHLYVGLEWYQPNVNLGPTDAWFDEVIIDSQPITCAK
jgi:hypothetical protein